MNKRIMLAVGCCGAWIAACTPNIKTVAPTQQKPLESVMVEGTTRDGGLQGPDHAVILVDDGPVGTPLFSYPRPQVFIPTQRLDGQATRDTVRIKGRNAAGVGNTFMYSVANVPSHPPQVTVDEITPPSRVRFSNEIAITVSGNGIFPGATNASLDHPHAGPPIVEAVPMDGGNRIAAVRVVSLTDNSIQAFFPDSMPHGSYRVYVKNDDRYGGVSGTSRVTFEWR